MYFVDSKEAWIALYQLMKLSDQRFRLLFEVDFLSQVHSIKFAINMDTMYSKNNNWVATLFDIKFFDLLFKKESVHICELPPPVFYKIGISFCSMI